MRSTRCSGKERCDDVEQTSDQLRGDGFRHPVLHRLFHDAAEQEPYQKDHREVVKIGVEFSAETRNINRWLVETR